MASNSMCLECSHNNNGWCKKHKMQRPKALEICTGANDVTVDTERKVINIDTNYESDIEIPNKDEFINIVQDMFCTVDNEGIDILEKKLIKIINSISQIERLNIILGRE